MENIHSFSEYLIQYIFVSHSYSYLLNTYVHFRVKKKICFKQSWLVLDPGLKINIKGTVVSVIVTLHANSAVYFWEILNVLLSTKIWKSKSHTLYNHKCKFEFKNKNINIQLMLGHCRQVSWNYAYIELLYITTL